MGLFLKDTLSSRFFHVCDTQKHFCQFLVFLVKVELLGLTGAYYQKKGDAGLTLKTVCISWGKGTNDVFHWEDLTVVRV